MIKKTLKLDRVKAQKLKDIRKHYKTTTDQKTLETTIDTMHDYLFKVDQ